MTPALAIETRGAGLGLAVLDAAGLGRGDRVLDVACGDGDVTLPAARRVGRRGLALGVDDSVAMLERARRRAGDEGLASASSTPTQAHIGSHHCASTWSSAGSV